MKIINIIVICSPKEDATQNTGYPMGLGQHLQGQGDASMWIKRMKFQLTQVYGRLTQQPPGHFLSLRGKPTKPLENSQLRNNAVSCDINPPRSPTCCQLRYVTRRQPAPASHSASHSASLVRASCVSAGSRLGCFGFLIFYFSAILTHLRTLSTSVEASWS